MHCPAVPPGTVDLTALRAPSKGGKGFPRSREDTAGHPAYAELAVRLGCPSGEESGGRLGGDRAFGREWRSPTSWGPRRRSASSKACCLASCCRGYWPVSGGAEGAARGARKRAPGGRRWRCEGPAL